MAKLWLSGLLALAAAVALGCGTAPSLAQFDRHANAICAQLSRRQSMMVLRAQARLRTGQGASDEVLAQEWREGAALGRRADEEVRALRRPPAHARDIGSLVNDYFREASGEAAIAEAYASEGIAAGEAREAEWQPLAVADARAALRLGMTGCAKAVSVAPAAS